MKRLNRTPLIISLLLVTVACSALSISSVAENNKWALESINPLNGIELMAFVVSYFLRSGAFVSYGIMMVFLVLICWGLYALLTLILRRIKNLS